MDTGCLVVAVLVVFISHGGDKQSVSGQSLLETLETYSNCYGNGRFMEVACTPNFVILIDNIKAGTKLSTQSCPEEIAATDTSRDAECCTADDATDCLSHYSADNYHTACMGKQECSPGINILRNSHKCPAIYPAHSTFITSNYYCIDSDRRWEMCSLTPVTETITGQPVYISNKNYPFSLSSADTGAGCSCSVETDNCDSTLYRFTFVLDLAVDSASGDCGQEIQFMDGNETRAVTCADNSGYTRTVHTTVTNYIRLSLTSTMQEDGGVFWFGFQASVTSAPVHVDCPAKDRRWCVPIGRDLGEQCSEAERKYCQTPDAVCGTNGICVCKDGFYDLDESCFQKVPLGQSCSVDRACLTDNAVCTGNCSCNTTYYELNGQCDKQVGLDETCSIDAACFTQNAVCSSSVCSCASSGFYRDGSSCPEQVGLHEQCTVDAACKVNNSVCTNNNCTCDTNFYADNLDCLEKQPLGGVCSRDEACAPENSECDVSGQCICVSDHFNNSGSCEPKVPLDTQCPSDEACLTTGAICNETCVCDPALFYRDGDNCLQKVELNETCIISDACKADNSVCLANTCQCGSAFYEESAACLPKQPLGGDCSRNDACLTDFAECDSSNRCACISTHFVKSGQCEPKKDLDATCSVAGSCLDPGSVCNVTCVCSSISHYRTGDNCTEKAQLGAACTATNQCYDVNAECDNQVCSCRDTHYSRTGTCTRKEGFGGACESSAACAATGSVCLELVCSCPADTYADDNDCKAKVALGVNCSVDDACLTDNAACVNDTCSCDVGYYTMNTTQCEERETARSESGSDLTVIIVAVCVSAGLLLLVVGALLVYHFVWSKRKRPIEEEKLVEEVQPSPRPRPGSPQPEPATSVARSPPTSETPQKARHQVTLEVEIHDTGGQSGLPVLPTEQADDTRTDTPVRQENGIQGQADIGVGPRALITQTNDELETKPSILVSPHMVRKPGSQSRSVSMDLKEKDRPKSASSTPKSGVKSDSQPRRLISDTHTGNKTKPSPTVVPSGPLPPTTVVDRPKSAPSKVGKTDRNPSKSKAATCNDAEGGKQPSLAVVPIDPVPSKSERTRKSKVKKKRPKTNGEVKLEQPEIITTVKISDESSDTRLRTEAEEDTRSGNTRKSKTMKKRQKTTEEVDQKQKQPDMSPVDDKILDESVDTRVRKETDERRSESKTRKKTQKTTKEDEPKQTDMVPAENKHDESADTRVRHIAKGDSTLANGAVPNEKPKRSRDRGEMSEPTQRVKPELANGTIKQQRSASKERLRTLQQLLNQDDKVSPDLEQHGLGQDGDKDNETTLIYLPYEQVTIPIQCSQESVDEAIEEMKASERPSALHLFSKRNCQVAPVDDDPVRRKRKTRRRKTRAINDPFLRLFLGDTETYYTK